MPVNLADEASGGEERVGQGSGGEGRGVMGEGKGEGERIGREGD